MSALRMLVAQTRVEQRIFWRNGSNVFFTFLFPLLLLGLFAPFADAEVLVPGIAALVIVSTTFQALAISISFHRDQGVLKRIMATPLPAGALIASKIASSALVALLELCIVLGVGALFFGVGLPVAPVMFLLAALLGIVAFSALGIALASLIPSGDAAPAVTNAVYLPMTFISAIFYPLDVLPLALQYVAQALPLYHLAEPMRAAWFGDGGATTMAVHAAALSAWAIAGVTYALLRFRWEPATER